MQDHTSRRFHELWDAFFTRWTLSAPCALTGEPQSYAISGAMEALDCVGVA
jgi:hypothetical protein